MQLDLLGFVLKFIVLFARGNLRGYQLIDWKKGMPLQIIKLFAYELIKIRLIEQIQVILFYPNSYYYTMTFNYWNERQKIFVY